MVPGEIFASEVDSNDDIDNFLTPIGIFQSQVITPCKE